MPRVNWGAPTKASVTTCNRSNSIRSTRKVREYLGEAYVVKGRLDLAQEQLQQIKSICGNTACEEYQDLAEAINDSSKT